MTSLISALLTAIMLMSGIGSGSVTVNNIAVTVNDETFNLDPSLTAAYTVEDGKAVGEAYMTLDGEQLFKTAIGLSEDGVTVAARDSAVTLTTAFIDSFAEAKQIDLDQFTETLTRFAETGADTGFDKAALSLEILKSWTASLSSEPVEVEGVTLNRVTGTLDNDTMLSTIDTVYRALMGDEMYTTFVKTMGAAQGDAEMKELSDFYRAMGLTFTMDIDALVNDDMFGTWDVIANYEMMKTDTSEGFNAAMRIHVESEDAEHAVCEARMEPTAELPAELVCTAALNGDDFTMNYTMNTTEDSDEAVSMRFDLTCTGGAFSFSMNCGTASEGFSMSYVHGGSFEAAITENGVVTGGVRFDVTFGSEAAALNAENAVVIAGEEDLNSIDTAAISAGYMNDIAKLMQNGSVAAFLQAVTAPAAETAVE